MIKKFFTYYTLNFYWAFLEFIPRLLFTLFFAVHYLGCFLDFLLSPWIYLGCFLHFSPAFSKSLKSSRRKIKVLKNYLAASAASAAPAAFLWSRKITVWKSKNAVFDVFLTSKLAQVSWRPRRASRATLHSPLHFSNFLKATCFPMKSVIVSTSWTSGPLKRELNETSKIA